MTDKIRITAEAQSLCRDHPLANDEHFLVDLSEALARLHHTATQADRVATLNKTTAEHAARVDADEIAKARAEERARVAAILALPESAGREASARHLALNTDMTADAAKGVLSGLPRGAAWGASSPTPAPSDLPFLRSADAPGGLVTSDMVSPHETEGEALISTEPMRPASASSAKSMWASVVAGLNREQAQPQQTTK